MALFRKKKAKATLEMPPPPPEKMADGADLESSTIPDIFHEVKMSEADSFKDLAPETDVNNDTISEQHSPFAMNDDMFSEIPEVEKARVPEMPKLPDIPEIEKMEKVSIPARKDGPIFTKSKDYQEVLGRINAIKDSIDRSEETFNKLNDLKNEKDKVFAEWKKQLEDVQRKLIYVEKSLFEV